MSDGADDRFSKGLMTALKLFPPNSSAPPAFEYPEEIRGGWNRFSISTVMGDVWGREAIDPKTRAMITIAVLTALDKPEQLKAYIGGGLNLGLTREEICETILHIAVYAGFPTAIQGFAAASEVFDGLDAAGSASEGE